MSTKYINCPIAKGKLSAFDEILKACGGRYLENPVEAPDEHGHWRVSYAYDTPEQANEHARRWERATRDIVEVRKDEPGRSPWRPFLYIVESFDGSREPVWSFWPSGVRDQSKKGVRWIHGPVVRGVFSSLMRWAVDSAQIEERPWPKDWISDDREKNPYKTEVI